MPCDNNLVECVGKEKVIEICKNLRCMLYVSCFPRSGHIELCTECYAEIEKEYPECIEE